VNASQQAANWANTDPDGRYNLQYRTALDEKVREQHQALEGITLPKENEFWDKFYPPNGWNCRCTVVEVRKSKYAESDAEEAMKKGEAATSQIGKDGKNRLEIFRFNPGKEEKLFPSKHPYQPRGCNGKLSALVDMPMIMLSADDDKCKAKTEIDKIWKKKREKKQKTIRERHLNLLQQNKGRSVTKSFGGKSITTKFNNKDGLKHFVNDVLVKTNRISEKDLPMIHEFMKDAKPLPRVDLYKDRNDGIERFYYLHDEKRRVIYQIAEKPQFKKDGQVIMHRFLYGVVND